MYAIPAGPSVATSVLCRVKAPSRTAEYLKSLGQVGDIPETRQTGAGRSPPQPAQVKAEPARVGTWQNFREGFRVFQGSALKVPSSMLVIIGRFRRKAKEIRPEKSDSAERDGRQGVATVRFFMRIKKPRPAGGGPGGVAPVGSRPALYFRCHFPRLRADFDGRRAQVGRPVARHFSVGRDVLGIRP